MNIAVLAGGRTPERDVSLRGGHRVLGALQELGHEARLLDPAETPLAEALQERAPDLCYLTLHGKEGEDGTVQRLLDLLGIALHRHRPLSIARWPSTSCSAKDALARAGVRDARVGADRGICAARSRRGMRRSRRRSKRVGLPCVVKPSQERLGAGRGHRRARGRPAGRRDGCSVVQRSGDRRDSGRRHGGGHRRGRDARRGPARPSRSFPRAGLTTTRRGTRPAPPSTSRRLGSMTRSRPRAADVAMQAWTALRPARRHPGRHDRGCGRPALGAGGQRLARDDRDEPAAHGRASRRHGTGRSV